MSAVHPRQHQVLAIAAVVTGIAASWLTKTPFGLVAPVAALFLYARVQAALFLALLAMAFAGSALAACLQPDAQGVALTWAAFFALALAVGAIVSAGAAAPPLPHSTTALAPVIDAGDRSAAALAAARAFWTGVPQVLRQRQHQGDGSFRWAETRSEPGYGVDVAIDDLVAEKALAATPSPQPDETAADKAAAEVIRAATIVEALFGNAWAFDADGRWIYLPAFAQATLGLGPPELNASLDEGHIAWRRLLHPDDHDEVAARWRHCLATGDAFNAEFRIRRGTGLYAWARNAARPVRDGRNRIVGWYGTSIDIDVYRKTMQSLRDRDQELSQLVDMVPSHLWRLTPGGEPAFFNKHFLDFLGQDMASGGGRDVDGLRALVEVVHPDDAADFSEQLDRSLATGEPFAMRYRLRRADGMHRWMSSRAVPLRDEAGAIIHWYGLCHDIDDQVTAEHALRDRERELTQLVDMVPSLLWRLAPDGELVFLSKRAIDFVGQDVAAVRAPGTSRRHGFIEAHVHPDDAGRMRRALDHSVATGESFAMRYRLRRADGAYRWMEGRAEPLRDEDGRILQWYGLTHDIDSQMRVERTLQESERSLRQLVETLPALIYCASPAGDPIYRSQRLQAFLGLPLADPVEAEGARLAGTLATVIHPDDLPIVSERYGHSLATGEAYAQKHRLRRFDGVYRWVETRAEPMRGPDGAIVQWNGVCLDIEDQVRGQEELRQAREALARAAQAASLAELSASIAHEVNQPLAAVVANSHACQRWLAAEPPNLERAQRTVTRIIRDANAAAAVVSRIRALFRQAPSPRTTTALAGVVAEALEIMAEEAARRRVRIERSIDRELPAVTVDPVQIQQVLVNLLRNGIEAMEDVTGDRRLVVRLRRAGDTVEAAVSDGGRGVAAPDRVFEPFFTTKSYGMGMGLAICRSIIGSHGGRLWVEANEPHGATFVFTLPVGADGTA